MRALLILVALLILPLLTPTATQAQGAATLIADSIFIPAGGTKLVAEGNVEVFYDGTRLSAQRITFDQTTDSLTIDGPVFIVAPDGTILTADAASLDAKLQNGLLRGARLVLNEQLQLAATQIDRVDGRYSQLYQVAATSCHVCTDGGTPLWEIRARRVVHDQDDRQLYFDDATFRVLGIPVFYLPRMRLPDPTLERATGLLTPRIRSSDTLGIGLKLPYFFNLSDHRDLTLTPYLATSTATLEAIYRQAFVRGDIRIEGAFTADDLTTANRGYLFAEGIFDLGDDVILRFDGEYTSDDAYLVEYGYEGKDRLDSEISLERVRDRDLTQASLTYFSSLRDGERSETLPPLLLDVQWERRVTPRWGGTFTFTSDLQSHYRETSADITGRDVARLGFGAGWQASRATSFGLVIDGTLGANLDYYNVGDDSTVPDTLRSTIYGQTILRYPMVRRSAQATHVIEPSVQLAWSDVSGDAITNEDSTATEFDQANLLALTRFSGEDAVENGLRGAVGLTWSRVGAHGWDSTLTVGRVFRQDPDLNFSVTSGLSETRSDWLISGQIRTPNGLSLDSRLILDGNLDVTKSETLAGWDGGKLDLSAGYIFLPEDTFETRDSDVSEWTVSGNYTFDSMWSMGANARYDVLAESPTRTGLRIGWQNECVRVDFSVSRRFTSSTTLSPSTDYGLTVALNGFGTSPAIDVPAHRCTNE